MANTPTLPNGGLCDYERQRQKTAAIRILRLFFPVILCRFLSFNWLTFLRGDGHCE
jgi:hypothetical protein